MKRILTPAAPAPRGHYSQAMEHGGLIYVSGTLPLDPGSGEPVCGSIEVEAERVLENLKAVLDAAGSGLSCVLRATVYVSDISHWAQVNAVYARYFGDHKPARTVVPVSSLHYGCRIEMDVVACLQDGANS